MRFERAPVGEVARSDDGDRSGRKVVDVVRGRLEYVPASVIEAEAMLDRGHRRAVYRRVEGFSYSPDVVGMDEVEEVTADQLGLAVAGRMIGRSILEQDGA